MPEASGSDSLRTAVGQITDEKYDLTTVRIGVGQRRSMLLERT